MVDSRTKHQTHFNLTQPPFGEQFFPYSCLRKYQVKLVGLISLSFYIRWLFLDEMNYLGFKPFCWWWIEKEAIESNLHSHRKTQFFSTQFRMEHCPYSHFCVTHIANASPLRHTEASPVFPTSFCGVFMHMWPYGVTKEFKLCCLPCWFTRWYCGMFWPGIEIILTGSLYSL